LDGTPTASPPDGRRGCLPPSRGRRKRRRFWEGTPTCRSFAAASSPLKGEEKEEGDFGGLKRGGLRCYILGGKRR